MDLETVRALARDDQRVFLLGRILSETTRMDFALRFLHSALRGGREGVTMDALHDSPDHFKSSIDQCRQMITASTALDEVETTALDAALVAAYAVYQRRNRFVHDQLRDELFQRGWWELVRMRRTGDEIAPASEVVTFDDMVDLVLDLVEAVWRLQGSALYFATGGWDAYALGTVEGHWDGSATARR